MTLYELRACLHKIALLCAVVLAANGIAYLLEKFA